MKRLPDAIALFLIILALLSVLLPFASSLDPLENVEFILIEKIRELSIANNYIHYTFNFNLDVTQPPLILWLGKLCLNITDNILLASRLPSIIISIFLLISVYIIATKYFDERVAFWWLILLLAAPLSYAFFRSATSFGAGMAFSFLAIYRLQRATFSDQHAAANFLAAAIYTGIASLAIGPMAILFCFSSYLFYWITERFNVKDKLNDVLMYFVLSLIIFAIWPLTLFFDAGLAAVSSWFVQLMPDYRDGMQFSYILLIIILGIFPINILAIGIKNTRANNSMDQRHFFKWINNSIIMLFVYLLVDFHAAFLLIIPLAFLAAFSISFYLKESFYWPAALNSLLLFVGGGLITLYTFVAWLPSFKNELSAITHSTLLSQCMNAAEVSEIGQLAAVSLGLILLISSFLLMKKKLYQGLILISVALFVFNACYMGSTLIYLNNSVHDPVKKFCQQKQSKKAVFYGYDQFAAEKILFYSNSKVASKNIFEMVPKMPEQYMVASTDDEKNIDIHLNKFKKLYKDGGYVFYEYQVDSTASIHY